MVTIGDRIRQRREALNITQEQLAEMLGYRSRSSINKVEVSGRGLPYDKIVAIARALQTTPDFLTGWEENGCTPDEQHPEATPRLIPVISRIPFGEPRFLDLFQEGLEATLDPEVAFALRVQDGSMSQAGIFTNSLVSVGYTTEYKNGATVVAIPGEQDAIVRRYQRFGDTVVLSPNAPHLRASEYSAKDVRLLGVVRAVKTDFQV